MSDDPPIADEEVSASRGVEPLPPWLESVAGEALAGRERWPHALLIGGPRGTGKRLLALHFARALLCEAPRDDGSGCGRCDSCRYVAAGQHPDLFVAEPVDIDEEGNRTATPNIRIDRVRELIDWAQLTSHRRRSKVALIAPADRLLPEGANALLKTLEEPPPSTCLMLLSDRPGSLLPTIVSRCRRLTVRTPAADAALRWLAAERVAEPAALLAQAGGAPYRARALADAGYQAERAAWIAALAKPETLSPIGLAARIDLAGRDERRERLVAAIDWLIAWTTDIARVASGGRGRHDPARAADLAALATRVARVSLFDYHRSLLRQRALAMHPLQPRLVAEALLLDYRALFAR